MSRYRNNADAMSEYAGKRARQIRGMFSRREAENFDGEKCTTVGREADDGSYEADEADVAGAAGIVARPSADGAVETVTAFVGANGEHPIVVSVIDHGRAAVIDAVGLDADETIVYTSQSVVKIMADGTVEIRSLGGTAVRLATMAELEALRDAFTGHVHPTAATGPPSLPGLQATPAVPITVADLPVNGTSVLKAE